MGAAVPGAFDFGSVDTSFLDPPQLLWGPTPSLAGPANALAGLGQTGKLVVAGGVGLALLLLLTPTPSGSRRR